LIIVDSINSSKSIMGFEEDFDNDEIYELPKSHNGL
jgi:hypothetical protein